MVAVGCMVDFAPFALGIICVGESTVWLLTRNNEPLYVVALVTFGIQLALLLAVAMAVIRNVVQINDDSRKVRGGSVAS